MLLGTATLGVAATAAGVAGAVLDRSGPAGQPPTGAAAAGLDASAGSATPADAARLAAVARRPHRGPHQPGVLTPPAPHGLLAAFECVDPDRRRLAETFRALSAELDELTEGRTRAVVDAGLPPPDNGVLDGGADPALVGTLSVGASLFDHRYGLGRRRPRELVPMPFLANDRLDPARCDGDLLLVLQAGHPDGCVHALRRIMRRTRAGLVLRWLQAGFNRPDPRPVAGQTQTRNLLGFKDGTANPDAGDAALMDDLVWLRPGAAEPQWTVGGTYQVVRVIRMFVEQWDRASTREQESIIGRHKHSGAPLGRAAETDLPSYPADPSGAQVPLDAHIRLANPRTAQATASRVLRRGFSYSRGVDAAGLLDQGLAFVSYQRRLAHFLAVQTRLSGEPLEEYIQAEGGGFFFALPGVSGPGDWLGRPLVES
jgi:deferrochelatase/peroxidase EfeB